MKNFILTRILRAIAKPFDGYKTQISGLIPFCTGIIALIGVLFPDIAVQYQLPESNMGLVLASFTTAFGLWGLGGKSEKNKKAVEEQTKTMKEMNTLFQKSSPTLKATIPAEPEEKAGGYRKPGGDD